MCKKSKASNKGSIVVSCSTGSKGRPTCRDSCKASGGRCKGSRGRSKGFSAMYKRSRLCLRGLEG